MNFQDAKSEYTIDQTLYSPFCFGIMGLVRETNEALALLFEENCMHAVLLVNIFYAVTQVGSIVYKSWSNQNAQDEISVKEILDEHNSKNDCKKIKCDISHGSHDIDPLGKRDYITAVIEQEV